MDAEMNDNLYGSEETLRKWYTSVPNMVDEYSDLDPYAFRLYCHIRRRIGEADGGKGACWESTAELAKTCKMSAGSVSKAKKTLNQDKITYELNEKNISVHCASRAGFIEEAPEVYKDIEEVIDVSCGLGITERIARVKPVLSVKG